VLSFFPEEPLAEVSDNLAAMRVRHLLSMSTGQDVDTWSYMVDRPDGDWIKGFLSVPVVHTPGTHFLYNTGATYMLSAIVQKTTGMKVVDYLEPRLFEPLGIKDTFWQDSPQGISAGGIGLRTKTEDIAKFGQLYLQKGMWQGKEILSKEWVEEATAVQISNSGMNIDWNQGYGYQFWHSRHNAYRGDGIFGQYCIVMPDQDAVLAITSGMDIFDMQQPLDLVWDILLPAMTPGALSDDAASHDALTKKLSSLNMIPAQGQATSPTAARVSGRTYAVDANALKLETIAFSFTEMGCTVSLKTAAGEEIILCGYGTWQRGYTTLFNQPLLFDGATTTASGAWRTEDTFVMVIRLYETPFYHTVVCHFIGDEMMIEAQINISMESMEPVLLTARAV